MKAAFSSLNWSVSRRLVLAWALALFAATALVIAGVGHEVDQQLQNLRADLLEKPASGQVVLVEIDAKSLQTMDSWPWPRQYYGQAVEKLSAAGAAQIAFDVDFSAHSGHDQDQIFADAIAKSDATIILPTFRQRASGAQSDYVESLPIKQLRENAFLASVNVHPDGRGQLNQYSFGTKTAGMPRPSLASMLAEVSGNIDENFEIDQTIDPATIPRLSFVDLLERDDLASRLSGKKILIGATAIELGDRYPISRFGVVPGVVIQAMATETLLQGTNLVDLGNFPPLIFAATMLLVCILIKRQPGHGVGQIAFAVGLALFGFLLLVEYLNLFTYSNVAVFFFLGIHVILQKFFAATSALKTSQFFNEISGLPNEAAMMKIITDPGSSHIATAHISNFSELLVVTNKESRMDLFNNLADRLKFLALEERIFHLDADMIAWIVKEDYIEDIAGHFDTANVLFQSPIMAGERKIKINAVFGISSESIDKSKIAAEQALATGKRWMSHDQDVDNAIDQKLDLLVELDQAIQHQDLNVIYQPKWNLPEDRLNGAEALVRWNHPKQGMISPEIFIPMLEKAGRIDELTYLVLQQALKDLSSWELQHAGLSCSINISAQLLGDSKFVEKIIAMVETSPAGNEQVIFEVTETAALADPELSVLALNRIRDAGIKISIDDYGTGQSTMSYLQRLPVNEIKIDQSFVKTMITDNANRVMVKSTIEMAHALGFKVVAEGIEDKQCMDLLTKYKCDVGQGWHISKPVTSEVFQAAWVDRKLDIQVKSG